MGGPCELAAPEGAHRVTVLRLRMTDDMPMAARVLVWPRDQGGYFIYVRPGTPRGSVRSALRGLKDTSAARRELTVIAFAARDAWRAPRERVMSFGAGLATTVIAGGLATSAAVSGMAVAPGIYHHGSALLPSRPRSVTAAHVPQSHSGTPGAVAGRPPSTPAAPGNLAPGAPQPGAKKSGAQKSGAQKPGAQKKASKHQAKKRAKATKPITAEPVKQAMVSAPKPVQPGKPKPVQHGKAGKAGGQAGKP
jgi:hypothetical protein